MDFRWVQGDIERGKAMEKVLRNNPDLFTGQGESEGRKGRVKTGSSSSFNSFILQEV